MSDEKQKCFIIMPITTPEHSVENYLGDKQHFTNVLKHLFFPAVEEAGFDPISPQSTGSNVIHADIILQLSQSDLVLCDMSLLNPNVFFEFGIRSALNKPVSLVVDDKTSNIPFDTGILNFYRYQSSPIWQKDEEIIKLAEHIRESYKKSKGNNSLWKHFGVTQTGEYNPESVTIDEKIDFLVSEVSKLREKPSIYDQKKIAETVFQQEIAYLGAEYKLKKEKAIRERDALTLSQLERELKQKTDLAELRRDLALSYLNLDDYRSS